jgi:hypothetical protein
MNTTKKQKTADLVINGKKRPLNEMLDLALKEMDKEESKRDPRLEEVYFDFLGLLKDCVKIAGGEV